MWVDAAYCERPRSVVCLSVCHLVSPAENSEVIVTPLALSRTRVGKGKDLLHIADRFGRILYCVHSTQYSLVGSWHNVQSSLYLGLPKFV